MTCERMEAQLIAYLDGRAEGAASREVEQHIEHCAACRDRAAEFRRVWNLLDDYPATDPSPFFDARLRARLAALPRPAWWRAWIPQPRLVLATAALFALGIWISAIPNGVSTPPAAAQNEEEFHMIRDMHVLENYEVLAEFDALSELPGD